LFAAVLTSALTLIDAAAACANDQVSEHAPAASSSSSTSLQRLLRHIGAATLDPSTVFHPTCIARSTPAGTSTALLLDVAWVTLGLLLGLFWHCRLIAHACPCHRTAIASVCSRRGLVCSGAAAL
jgi:hypothetical protein